ncbi:MAG: hypothetical protein DRI75_11455 [Bacteroidetes bacterium]|nr:MAG: hypothetical protein DRI75_11455 [Bacteroidota bacterium]
MEKNKTGQYLKYAIGEIVLVVIGILIALSINNWSKSNQLSNQEYKLVLELKNDLTETQNELIEDINTLSQIIQKSDSIITYLNKIEPEEFDLNLYGANQFTWASFNVKLYPRTIAYENLKSLEIQLVANDSIRFYITDIFDRKLPRIVNWEANAIDSQTNLNNALEQNLTTIKSDNYEYYSLIPFTFTKDSKKLFVNRLAILQNDRISLNSLYTDLLDQINALLKLLENEYFQSN